MRTYLITACFMVFAAAAFAAPSMADSPSPVYLLFANTSSHPIRVKDITVGGKPCPACTNRTVAPGTVAMVKIGDLGSNHLKLAITGDGSGTCHYDIASTESSESGDCGSSPKIDRYENEPSGFFSETDGTPTFEVFYAYDPRKRKQDATRRLHSIVPSIPQEIPTTRRAS